MTRDEELQYQYDRVLDQYKSALKDIARLADEEIRNMETMAKDGYRFYQRQSMLDAASSILEVDTKLRLLHNFSWSTGPRA